MIYTSAGIQKAKEVRSKQRKLAQKFKLEDFLFKQQLDFVLDKSPFKVAMCSRRAGKTISCAADLIHTAISNPDVVCLYITLSRSNAKRIIWKELRKINSKYKLGGKETISELSITFPVSGGESTIYLSGAKDLSEIEKFRGMALKLVYIDEAQSFRAYIQELVNESLGATLVDHAGTICLIGTPPPVPNGYFIGTYSDEKNAWSRHHWTFFDNPFLPKTSKKTHEELLERELARRGVSRNDPSIRREFFGECVVDTRSLILQYDVSKNHYTELPSKKFIYILGVDIGHDDADALAVLAWSENDPNIYLVEEKLNKGQDITDLMHMIQETREKYDISKIVIDTGGLGKKISEELIRRYSIPLQMADKVRKMEIIKLLNDFLRTSRFKAKASSKFAEDTYLVEINRDKTTPDRIVVSDRYHSDIIDAVLYAFKECHAYTYRTPIEPPKRGTDPWFKSEEEQMYENTMREIEKQKEDDDFWGQNH